MIKIVLLKRETFSLILVVEKALSQLELLTARLIRSKSLLYSAKLLQNMEAGNRFLN